LLVHFHIKYICEQTTKNQIMVMLERLKNSPTKERPLDPTYNRAMESIRRQGGSCLDLALKIFVWLVNSRRTLTIEEIQIAVSIQETSFVLDDGGFPDRFTLLGVCAGLVIIDESSRTVRLAHYTVKEYFIRTSVTSPLDSAYEVVNTCVTYLLFDVFTEGACVSNDEVRARYKSCQFFDYSVRYLSSHLVICDEELSKDIVHSFVTSPGNVSSYLQAKNFPENSGKHTGYDSFPKEQRPLHIAAALGHCKVIEMLLAVGSIISVLDSHKQTALHVAASEGQELVAELLIQKGIDTSIHNHHGQTALHLAALKGYEEVVRVLLCNGVDISACDYLGYTALHYATIGDLNTSPSPKTSDPNSLRGVGVVRVLLDNGASTSSKTNSGRTALHMAAYRGNEKATRQLLSVLNSIEASTQDNSGQTPLHLAVSRRNENIIQILVENRVADFSIVDNKGYTALDIATKKGHLELSRYLLENGAVESDKYPVGRRICNMNSRWTSQLFDIITTSTEIIISNQAHKIHLDSVKNFLEKGASISALDPYGENILHLAIKHEAGLDVIKLLLERGADISALDKHGDSMLQLAIKHKALPGVLAVKLLIEKGADVLTLDQDGNSALQLAIKHEAGLGVIKLLLERGADISALDKHGDSMLQLAIKRKALPGVPTVKLLIEKGADILTLGQDGDSVLQLAIRNEAGPDVIEFLIKKGADISGLDKDGNSALHLALRRRYDRSMVKLLIERGADISGLDQDGNSVLSLAIKYDASPDMINLIIKGRGRRMFRWRQLVKG
jgi:ankyrin repeat protein